MRYIIEADILLMGRELEIKRNVSIYVEDGIIGSIGLKGFSTSMDSRTIRIDLRGGIIMPPLVNSHIHMADIGFEEVGWDLDIDSLVGEPYGLKYIMLRKFEKEVPGYIARALRLSRDSGVMMLNDFREMGLKGLRQGVKAGESFNDMIYIPSYMPDPESRDSLEKEIREALSMTKWIGISSPHYYDHELLKLIDSYAREHDAWIISHVAETRDVREERDFERLRDLRRLRAVVHGIYLSFDELLELRDRGVSLIICPRSNMWFGSGEVNKNMFEIEDLRIGLGTDNAGWIKPDLWREAEVLVDVMRLKHFGFDPREVLKYATVYGGEIFGFRNYIEEGLEAALIGLKSEWLNPDRSGNIYLSIIKRGGIESIRITLFRNSLRIL
ncbi:MAG: amidohydrolase family protein [Sulfolobales archaeon]